MTSGVARDPICTGLAGGDKALADRLMRIERRIVALEQQGQETNTRVHLIDKTARDLLAMFEALLQALTAKALGRQHDPVFGDHLLSRCHGLLCGCGEHLVSRVRGLAAERHAGRRKERSIRASRHRSLHQRAWHGLAGRPLRRGRLAGLPRLAHAISSSDRLRAWLLERHRRQSCGPTGAVRACAESSIDSVSLKVVRGARCKPAAMA